MEQEAKRKENQFSCEKHNKTYFSESAFAATIRDLKRQLVEEKEEKAKREIERVQNKRENSLLNIREKEVGDLMKKLTEQRAKTVPDETEIAKLENEIRGLERVIRGRLSKQLIGRKTMATPKEVSRVSINIGRLSSRPGVLVRPNTFNTLATVNSTISLSQGP
jgi:hypothetical protein